MTAILYLLAFVMSILPIYILVTSEKGNNIRYYILMFVSVTVSNAGYLALVTAENIEEAVLANQISYLGGCFLPLFMLQVICELCDVKMNKIMVVISCLYSIVILGLSMTIGYSSIYYEDVHIEQYLGATRLVKEYGTFHVLYTILLAGYLIACLIVIIYSFFKKRNVSYRSTVTIFLAEIFVLCTYTFERVFHSEFEWLAFAYIIFEVVVLMLFRHTTMYDIMGNIVNAQNHEESFAYIVFDLNHHYIGNNALAERFFPELKDIRVDSSISKDKQEYLYENFIRWIDVCAQNKQNNVNEATEQVILRNGNELKCNLRNLYYGRKNRIIGYLVEITDDTRQQEYIHLINNYNNELEASVLEKTEHIRNMQDKMILGMANIVESRDDDTGGHIRRTREVVRILIQQLHYNKAYEQVNDAGYCEYVVKAAPMHDLGKIVVADSILKKPGRYIPEEYKMMQLHAAKGSDIVETVLKDVEDDRFVEISKNIAHYHHEKWDGTGYPEGLAGTDIPLEARIMAVADVFDALVSKRCYKEKTPYQDAIRIIKEAGGTQFDPVVVEAFLQCSDRVVGFYKITEG